MKTLVILGGSIATIALISAQADEPSPQIGQANDSSGKCVSEQFVSSDTAPNPTSAAKLTELKANLPGWLAETGVPATSVAYIEDGKVQWTVVCGEMKEGQAATLETRFNTASIAKPMVGEIALRLFSDGVLSLDEPMSSHWVDPDITGSEYLDRLTPRIALSHQTGFANWRRMTGDKLQFRWEPGSQTGYSGEGIQYVTRFIEAKFSKPFEVVARNMLFRPSGMNEASFVADASIQKHIAWGRSNEGEWSEPFFNEEPLGAGDVWITSADYARFLSAVMKDARSQSDQARERKAINRDEVSQWCGEGRTPVENCPPRMGFGVGWYVYEYEGETVFAHNGSNFVDKSLAIFVPQSQTGFVAFANGENGKATISRVARVLYDNEDYYTLEGY
jgi:CubicO group peptidase (beta-lactamase class C family)